MMEIKTNCPCCGHPVEAYPIEKLAAIVTPVMGKIVERLLQCAGSFVSGEALARAAWRRESNGGPINPRVNICNAIAYNKRRLHAMGWDIEGRKGPGGGYRLVRLAPRC